MNMELPLNKLVTGNNVDVLATFPECSIDATITSPPYDNLMTYKSRKSQKDYTFDAAPIAKQLYRVTKNGGVVVWVIGDATLNGSETCSSFKQALLFREAGFNLHDTMIWYKTNPLPSFRAPRYNQTFEYMFVFSKGKPKTFNPLKEPCKTAGQEYKSVKVMGSRNKPVRKILDTPKIKKSEKTMGNVWMIGTAAKNYGHPAVFPEVLAERHILTWTNPGEIVLDPFCGSGTTLVIAVKQIRQYIGIDIAKEYCDTTRDRIGQFEKMVNEETIKANKHTGCKPGTDRFF